MKTRVVGQIRAAEIVMNRALGPVLALLVLAGPPAAAAAPPYDGSTPMQCSIQAVMSCPDPKLCVRGTAATVNLPPVVKVDVGEKLISGAATGRTVKIAATVRESGRLVVYGTEPGGAGGHWSVVVTEASGNMSGAVVGQQGGYLIFGSCTG